MAMKEVWTHPKFKALKMRLGLADWQAVGLLESVWGICVQVKSCREGLIAWEPKRIAAYIGWSGDAVDMVDALVECGWLDRDGDVVRVHDWDRHAPRWIKGVLEKQRKQPTPPHSVANSVGDSVADSVGHSAGMGGGKGVLGLGVQGEGVDDAWFQRLHRWPQHKVVTIRTVDAQVSAAMSTLSAEGIETDLAAPLLRRMVQDWPEDGVDVRTRLGRLLGGLNKGVNNRGAVLRSRILKTVGEE